ncbi:MAG: glycosyltransferase involved in cell wall biosynthesis [Candidatus Promineifilaceae bacterium]|jgi:glycosyltransferase involved in cell wall biosynthesis
MNAFEKTAIMHVALNPYTGAWSVMRDLASAQKARGCYAGVALGVIADERWPQTYRHELASRVDHHYFTPSPKLFGTASFLYQRIRRPGIEQWVDALADATGADHVIVHFHNAWMTGVFLPLGKTHVPVACVATVHGVNAEFGGQPVRRALHRWMSRRLANSSASLTSVDAANLDRARSILGLTHDQFTVVPNGVTDTDARGCHYATRGAPLVIGHVGTLSERKGWHITADAVKHLFDQGKQVKLILAGRGQDDDKAKAFADANPEFVDFRGFVSNPRESVFPELDVLTAMSVQEGLPMSIIEAMSVGVPVVATAVGGIPEAVTEGVTGHLISRDSTSLAAILTAFYDDPQTLQRMSLAGRQIFLDRFEINKILDAYDVVYGNA